MRRWMVGALLAASPIIAHPSTGPDLNDTTIRILLVADRSIVNLGRVDQHMQYLQNAWNSSNLSTPISITLANGGSPIEYTDGFLGSFSGSVVNQYEQLKTFASTPSITLASGEMVSPRDFHAADLVFGFSITFADNTKCGTVTQEYWTSSVGEPLPTFQPSLVTFNLDLRGADDAYAAMINASEIGPCSSETNFSAHEFGHLLGAHHWDRPSGDSFGLYNDSRSDRTQTIWPPGAPPNQQSIFVYQTVVGTGADSGCPSYANFCGWMPLFSSSTHYGTAQHSNVTAMNDTAESVANYRRGDPLVSIDLCQDGIDNDGDGTEDSSDPECVGSSTSELPPPPAPPPNCTHLVAPFNVAGILKQQCYIDSSGVAWSLYDVSWSHSCPGEVAWYEVHYSQPDGSPYVRGWTVFQQSSEVLVDGPPSRIKVKSCVPGGSCSNLSSDSFLALDRC